MFPKIKKDVLEFVSNEDGRISQESLIRLGVVSVGALGVATSAGASSMTAKEYVDRYIDVTKPFKSGCSEIEIACKDVVEVGGQDVVMHVSPKFSGSGDMGIGGGISMDECSEAKKAIIDRVNDDWKSDGVLLKENIIGDKDGKSYYSEFKLSLNGASVPPLLHHHDNSLNLSGQGFKIIGEHEHDIIPGCNVKGTLKMGFESCGSLDNDLDWATAKIEFRYKQDGVLFEIPGAKCSKNIVGNHIQESP